MYFKTYKLAVQIDSNGEKKVEKVTNFDMVIIKPVKSLSNFYRFSTSIDTLIPPPSFHLEEMGW